MIQGRSLGDDQPTLARSPGGAAPPSALLPGVVLAHRYRVVAPLGHGGMGDVYRAEDLKLGQGVALKFLPAAFRADEARRQRLRDEVRLARLVAHPNVCRVWDLVEAEGQEFLSMEYVDGEDLASVLRRIGRLPEERAVRMARELCAGLSAIHEQGILHRDFKPANVMVDGRGRARIADFGLAALTDRVRGAEASEGTPAYMAPEQREGREVSVRSDIYALGLVLFEIFTGKPADTHRTSSSPSSHVKELDPAIDRTIERCLAPDSSLRPPTAAAVAAALPGGDPLAAALAAGETPSPELVAAVGGTGRLRPRVALAGLAAALAGTALMAILADRVAPFFLDLDKPPDVLAHEAQQILEDFGPSTSFVDHAQGFVREGSKEPRRLLFWYRQSSRPLSEGQQDAGPLSFANPPPLVPGMAGVRVDAAGVLVEYVRVSGVDEAASNAVDWAAILRRAGLEPARFRETAASALAPVAADVRRAWLGERGGEPIRAEAASIRGRLVWFRAASPDAWNQPPARGGWDWQVYLLVAIFVLAAVQARRQLRFGRADRDGARRIAVFGVFWMIAGNGPLKEPRVLEPSLVLRWVELTLLVSVFFWLSYLALEPSVRRRWPSTLVSWTRLLHGRLLDPLVGRDVLVGVLGGVTIALLSHAWAAAVGVRWPASEKHLAGGWYALADRVVDCGLAVFVSLMVLMLLALLRQRLRRTWAAMGAVLVFLLAPAIFGGAPLSGPLLGVLVFGTHLGLLIWPGLLSAVVARSVFEFLGDTLMTTHLGAWYATSAVSGILATLAVSLWGFYASLGGQPLLGEPGTD